MSLVRPIDTRTSISMQMALALPKPPFRKRYLLRLPTPSSRLPQRPELPLLPLQSPAPISPLDRCDRAQRFRVSGLVPCDAVITDLIPPRRLKSPTTRIHFGFT